MSKPSDFSKVFPYSSLLQDGDSEQIAKNIMLIIARTQDAWRVLPLDEYEQEIANDGRKVSHNERIHFNLVVAHCASEDNARNFSPSWAGV